MQSASVIIKHEDIAQTRYNYVFLDQDNAIVPEEEEDDDGLNAEVEVHTQKLNSIQAKRACRDLVRQYYNEQV